MKGAAIHDDATLDKVFWALSDVTRRQVLQTLEQGGSTVTELAGPHGMSLPGFMKHLRVLEDAGLVTRSKEGRVVSCELAAQPMQEAAMWLSRYSKFWNDRLDALGRYLYHQEEVEPWPKAPSSSKSNSASPAATPSSPPKSGARGPSRKR
ncbi:helix-turn-helix transcriptional regulator [uncultured Ramlibacter sp.]|uniref:ArsR/SmtB family transcription factor n=1 Tax=uncultured Ramlibacter sp. TaxID=260755 RepID=UPI0026397FAD|nr:metalloregulator ArsR/SmtB family transcription factor [uncultured Ramlibacter sp.]